MKIDVAAQLREAVDLVADMESTAAADPKSKAKPIRIENRDALVAEIYEFIVDRLRGYYADAGIRHRSVRSGARARRRTI